METDPARPLTPFDRIAADRLADEVAALVTRRVLDSRSVVADALLDYREPPRTERSDRIAALEARLQEMEDSEVTAGYILTSFRKIREALKAAGLWRHRQDGQGGTGDCAVEAIARLAGAEERERKLRAIVEAHMAGTTSACWQAIEDAAALLKEEG